MAIYILNKPSIPTAFNIRECLPPYFIYLQLALHVVIQWLIIPTRISLWLYIFYMILYRCNTYTMPWSRYNDSPLTVDKLVARARVGMITLCKFINALMNRYIQSKQATVFNCTTGVLLSNRVSMYLFII